MPAHITSAIAAYPWLASRPNPPAAPASDWGILPDVINPNPRNIAFFETVLDQVMRLFPSKLIHIGGDEAMKDHWNANPAVRAQMQALGLEDAEGLQAWFMARIAAYVAAHGRQAIGWDKSAPLPAEAVVMSWAGSEAAVAAIKAGHETILAPAPVFYINNRQSQSNDEPPGRRDIISWQRVYQADAPPAGLSDEERARVLGLHVALWTEYVRTTEQTDRMIWPRASVLAEIGWSSAPREWEAFAPRLLAEIKRQQSLGLSMDLTPLEPMGRFTAAGGGKVRAVLDQPAALGTLRYTLDGSAPRSASPAYSEPLLLGGGTVLTVRAFADAEPLGSARNWRMSAALTRTLARRRDGH
ncbi:Beta-hexosaminidase precursor, putative, partial [Ricinus communis]